MPNANAVLRHKAFWPYYVQTNEHSLEGDILEYFEASPDEDDEREDLEIRLPCGPDHALSVSLSPDWYHIDLSLTDSNSDSPAQMGWWDEARWHPFAIRWDELLALDQYWRKCPALDHHSSAAFLLVAVFVGHGVDEKKSYEDRKNVIHNHYSRLNLYSDAECLELTEKTLILPTEDDYNWTQDNQLGWVFGGEYPCYSLRNSEHSGGEEGAFPFVDWRGIVDRLQEPEVS